MRSTLFVTGLMCAVMAACGGKSGGSQSPGGAHSVQVIEIEPRTGSPDGGDAITIKGEGFMTESRTVTVFFGDAQAQVIDIPSDTEVKIQAPPGAAGTSVDVIITFDPGGEIKLPHGYTFAGTAAPAVAAPEPTAGT